MVAPQNYNVIVMALAGLELIDKVYLIYARTASPALERWCAIPSSRIRSFIKESPGSSRKSFHFSPTGELQTPSLRLVLLILAAPLLGVTHLVFDLDRYRVTLSWSLLFIHLVQMFRLVKHCDLVRLLNFMGCAFRFFFWHFQGKPRSKYQCRKSFSNHLLWWHSW